MTCPSSPAPSYQAIHAPMVFQSSTFLAPLSESSPSYPNPVQGQCLCNCPFIAALASIAWVNKNFIMQNGSVNKSGNYTFNFWDYKGQVMPTSTNPAIALNPVNASGNPTGVLTPVTVGPQVIQDNNLKMSDSNGIFYGAGSNNANEVWPALYEKAYAKFCMYENSIPLISTKQPISSGNLTNTSYDPTYADVLNLSKTQWGGNAAIALMYLTGRNCYAYPTASSGFTALGGVSATVSAGPSLYNYIDLGFCQESNIVFGLYKTRYPLVAWTYPSESASPAGLYNAKTNPSGIQYNNPSGIVANHCYPILGAFDSNNGSNGSSYIVLRTTYGVQDPNPNLAGAPPLTLARSPSSIWQWGEAEFPIGLTPQNPGNAATQYMPTRDLSLQTDAIFGLEQSQFQKYFSYIGWAKGY